MQAKRQNQNELLTQLIEQYQFEPTGHCADLYVSQRTGAILYRSGGVLEIDFGFDEPSPIQHAAWDKASAFKCMFGWIRRIKKLPVNFVSREWANDNNE